MNSSISILSTNCISVLNLGKVVMQQSKKKIAMVFINEKRERIAKASVVKNTDSGSDYLA